MMLHCNQKPAVATRSSQSLVDPRCNATVSFFNQLPGAKHCAKLGTKPLPVMDQVPNQGSGHILFSAVTQQQADQLIKLSV